MGNGRAGERGEAAERSPVEEATTERLEAALGRSPMSLYENDTELRYTWIAGPRFGFEPEALIGKRDDEILPRAQVAELIALKRRALTEERPQRRVIATRVRGRDHAFDVYAEPFRGEDGSVAGLRVATFDITEQLEAVRRLREADRRKDEFIAMLGHELRNPLAAIRGASDVFGLVAPADDRTRRARDVLERQTRQMGQLVDGLLDISRIARGKVELRRAVLDLSALLREVVEDSDHRARELGLELTLDAPADPVWLRADRVRMVQVLDNVLGNAIKFTEAPGAVSLSLRVDGGLVEVLVRDDGVGIRPELLPAIFEPFQQEKQEIARGAGGLGLGLALSKGLIELHGGAIDVQSAGPGEGTTVTLQLPLAEPATDGSRAALRDDEALPCSILLIEDQIDAGVMLQLLLEAKGHRVRLVTEAYSALERASEEPPDVIVCDLGLPGMDGYALARTLRDQPELRHLPLIALTGYGDAEARARTRASGFDAHFVKPLDVGAFDALLRDLARRRPR